MSFDGKVVYKLYVLGDSGVGKSSLIHRFVKDRFDFQESTIGQEFYFKNIEFGGKIIKLQIWDSVGGERYRAGPHYKGVHGVFIVFDTDYSFRSVDKWIEDSQDNTNKDVNIMLLGAKCDLTTDKTIKHSTAKEFANARGMTFIETSSKYSINVELAFFTMISEIQSKIEEGNTTPSEPESSCCIG